MLVKKFEWTYYDEWGTWGWLAVNAPPEFQPVADGRGVAHDTLEHFADTTGTWEDELQAFGAMVFVRGHTGGLRNMFISGEQVLANDLMSALNFFFPYENYEPEDQPQQRREVAPIRTYNTEDYGIEFIDKAIALVRTDFNGYYSEYSMDGVPEALKRIRGWLIHGYRRAKRRFHNDSDVPMYLFDTIKREVDLKTKFAEDASTLTIICSLLTGDCQVNYKDAYYGDDYA